MKQQKSAKVMQFLSRNRDNAISDRAQWWLSVKAQGAGLWVKPSVCRGKIWDLSSVVSTKYFHIICPGYYTGDVYVDWHCVSMACTLSLPMSCLFMT